MRFERVAANVKTSLHCRDAVVDNKSDGDFAQSHSDHFAETHRRIGDSRPDPETEEAKNDDPKHDREDRQSCYSDKTKQLHIPKQLSHAEQCGKVKLGPREGT